MTNTYSPQAAAEQARDSFRQAAKEFEKLKLDTTVPESVRALAEKTVNQSREAYERGKEALEEAFDSLERSFDAAGQGATAFNRKLIDLAQRNLNSAFDLAKSLAGAKNLGEIVELQSAFIRHQFDFFASQAGEIRALTTKIAADTTEPHAVPDAPVRHAEQPTLAVPTAPRPHVRSGLPVSAYSDDELDEIITWITSDGSERNREELAARVREELGMTRRSSRVDAVVAAAVRRATR